MRFYDPVIHATARKAICSIIKSDYQATENLLHKICLDFTERQKQIPAHQLQSNLTQEALLVLEIYD